MRANLGIMVSAGLALSTLAACGSDDPKLMNLRSRTADEFAIVPTKPLEIPENVDAKLADLPVPTPGGANLVDPTPQADAVAALGGNPAALNRGTAVPASDSALVARASRFGTQGDAIRAQLDGEDLKWRQDHQGRFLDRMFKPTRYYQAYDAMSLDQHAELDRWRARGVRTVGAPPDAALLKAQNGQ